MTPAEVRRVRKRLRLTQREFAKLLGVHEITVAKWERGMQPMRNTHALLIRLVATRRRK
jgi:DNA-binding transcriptional regulator YiaG